MEHVIYLAVKKAGRGKREPVAIERLQLEQTTVSRVTLLEPYLEAWRHPSHVCGVIWDKIRESCGENAGLRERHRQFPDYQVWDRSFQGYLQRRELTGEWLRVWRVPMFEQYGGPEQMQMFLNHVEGWRELSQVLVLGCAPDMEEWLPRLARRVRGIDFYMDYEPRDMEEMQERMEEEYGLVTQWRILPGESYQGLSQYLHSYSTPCLVLDLTDRADVPVTGLKPGSMWWDLGAKEEKRHLLEDRPLGVRYVSLRTLWRDFV